MRRGEVGTLLVQKSASGFFVVLVWRWNRNRHRRSGFGFARAVHGVEDGLKRLGGVRHFVFFEQGFLNPGVGKRAEGFAQRRGRRRHANRRARFVPRRVQGPENVPQRRRDVRVNAFRFRGRREFSHGVSEPTQVPQRLNHHVQETVVLTLQVTQTARVCSVQNVRAIRVAEIRLP